MILTVLNHGIVSSARSINYTNGLYGKRYVGYFADDVNWFATATLQGGPDSLKVNFSTATITKTTNGLGYYYYNPITNGF